MTLWLDDTEQETLSTVDNDTYAIDSVRMGARAVDAGTGDTVYFDDFEARRLGYIDVLDSPYTPPQPSPLNRDPRNKDLLVFNLKVIYENKENSLSIPCHFSLHFWLELFNICLGTIANYTPIFDWN